MKPEADVCFHSVLTLDTFWHNPGIIVSLCSSCSSQSLQPVGGTCQWRSRLRRSQSNRRRVARLHQDGPVHGALPGGGLLVTGHGGPDDLRVRWDTDVNQTWRSSRCLKIFWIDSSSWSILCWLLDECEPVCCCFSGIWDEWAWTWLDIRKKSSQVFRKWESTWTSPTLL